MTNQIFTIHSWPRAIVHLDGDAFFTSCEEAIHPELKGRPLITGGERGIVACASYAAKARGIKRGVPLAQAKALCPELVILPSDYETYSLFSRRMFNIMRRFTPQVEEYSIDEAFADITGMRRALNASYEDIAALMKKTIERELGIGVSVGLSITKVLAKVASKHKKPDGLTIIPGRSIADFLQGLPVEKIWGIGHATTNYLAKMGIKTALEFASLPERTAMTRFTKPGQEIWRELRGDSVYLVSVEEKSSYVSISKMKTFAPPSGNEEYLYAHLLRNLESACIKARRYGLAARRVAIMLKQNDFSAQGREVKLNRPSAYPHELSGFLRTAIADLCQARVLYRATGVVLLELAPNRNVQYSLFEDPIQAERIRELYGAVDQVSAKYGKHSLHLGGSHPLEVLGKGRRGAHTAREDTSLFGETKRKHLGLPLLHIKV
ncbi:MAG: DNA polymerase IV [Smithellaceae bacterium]|nr:DNA polymerase IV [Smithellaceae bacterium]